MTGSGQRIALTSNVTPLGPAGPSLTGVVPPRSRHEFQSGGFVSETDFSDGTVTYSVRAMGACVNLETGARSETLDTFKERDQLYADTGLIVGAGTGRTTFHFLPGDHARRDHR